MSTLKVNRKYTYSAFSGSDTMVITKSDNLYTEFRIVSGNKTRFMEYVDEKTILRRDTRTLLLHFKLVNR